MASVVRISNSPLVRAIPWTTQGIQDESWMNWTAESLRIPTYFKYKEFIQKVKAVTIFAIPGTQHGLFVRHFFGYRDAVSATAGNAKSEVGEVFFALRLIDFIASELRGPIISSVPTTPWPLNVKLLGQNLAVVKLLKDWQEVITVAEAAWNSYKTENEEQHTKAEIAVLPGSPETLRSQALYHNYVTSFRRHPYEHVMCNFRLAAFVLGWYFAGEFDTSKNFVLEQLKHHGFRTQIEEQEEAIITGMKDVKDPKIPLKLALLISPLVLLLPKPLATWTFNNAQLIYIFKTLRDSGPCPRDLETIQDIAIKEVWRAAQGIKTAEKAAADFFLQASAVPRCQDSKHWFDSLFLSPPPPPAPPLSLLPFPDLQRTYTSSEDGGPQILEVESTLDLSHRNDESSMSDEEHEPTAQVLPIEFVLNHAFKNNEQSGRLDPGERGDESSVSDEENEPTTQVLPVEFALNHAFKNNEQLGRLDPGERGDESSMSDEDIEPTTQVLPVEFALNHAFKNNEQSGRLDPGERGDESSMSDEDIEPTTQVLPVEFALNHAFKNNEQSGRLDPGERGDESSMSDEDIEPTTQVLPVEFALNHAFKNNEQSGRLDPGERGDESSMSDEDIEPTTQVLPVEFALNHAFKNNEQSGRLDPGERGDEHSSDSSSSDNEESSSLSNKVETCTFTIGSRWSGKLDTAQHSDASESEEESFNSCEARSSSLSEEDEPSPQIVQNQWSGNPNRAGRLYRGWNDNVLSEDLEEGSHIGDNDGQNFADSPCMLEDVVHSEMLDLVVDHNTNISGNLDHDLSANLPSPSGFMIEETTTDGGQQFFNPHNYQSPLIHLGKSKHWAEAVPELQDRHLSLSDRPEIYLYDPRTLEATSSLSEPALDVDEPQSPRKRGRDTGKAPDYTNTQREPRKKRRKGKNASPERGDNELRDEHNFVDLTGDDELRWPQVQKFIKQSENSKALEYRDSIGIPIYCFEPDKSAQMSIYTFRGFQTMSQHPLTQEPEEAKENDYRVASQIQASFLRIPLHLDTPASTPLYHLDSAYNAEYTPGCSDIFVTSAADWCLLDGRRRQKILAKRHLLIPGLTSESALQLDRNTCDLMGIPLERALDMHDMSLRTSETTGQVAATAEKFLSEAASEDGLILSTMPIPMHFTNFPDPVGLSDLNTTEVALANTQSLSGCQYGPLNHWLYTKWGAAACGGASTLVRCDAMATLIDMKAGQQMIYLASAASMDTIDALSNFHRAESFVTPERTYEGVLLKAGDVLIIRPNTLRYTMTVEASLTWVRSFQAMSTMLDTFWGHIHTSMMPEMLSYPAHSHAPPFFIQVQAYWWKNIKQVYAGRKLGPYTEPHIPDIQSWPGLLQMLFIGNMILLLEALDHRSYVVSPDSDERKRQAIFRSQSQIARQISEEFRSWFISKYVIKQNGTELDIEDKIFRVSILHLTIVVGFYAKRSGQYDQAQFRKKLTEAVENYSGAFSNRVGIMILEQTAMLGNDQPPSNSFLPPEWTEDADSFSIEPKV